MISVECESWPLAEPFTISRGTKTAADVVLVTIKEGGRSGRGECVPYRHYGETVQSVVQRINDTIPMLAGDLNRTVLQTLLPPGAARNALDCALWDLEAKTSGRRAWDLAGIQAPGKLTCAYTLSLDSPERMQAAAKKNAHLPLLKVKVGADGPMDRINAVRIGAPDSALIVDANEAWTVDRLCAMMPELAAAGVDLIEQPLPAGQDGALAELEHKVPLAADESCHTADDVDTLIGRYDVINIKLDKTGGLTGALALAERAQQNGLDIMVGCMVGTSLAMAPAMLIGAVARFVDLDGPLLLAEDRTPGLRYDDGLMAMPDAELWG